MLRSETISRASTPSAVTNVAEAGEAGGAVSGGFVALDLLFGDPEFVGEASLAPAFGDAGFDEGNGQFRKRCGLEGADDSLSAVLRTRRVRLGDH